MFERLVQPGEEAPRSSDFRNPKVEEVGEAQA
jgi:hypothetical protein